MKRPMVDIGACSQCMGCVELCPEVFRVNENTGYIEVIDLPEYDRECIDEAIKYCPQDCIVWEEES